MFDSSSESSSTTVVLKVSIKSNKITAVSIKKDDEM